MDDPSSPPTLPPEASDERKRAGSLSEPTEPLGQDDVWVPTTPAASPGSAAGEALRALAHVARSFMLYDATNERIRGFLEDARAKIEHFLKTHGQMRLEVRPWDFVLGGDVVYSDKDRERSLAFRLYRDGVRRLTLHPDLEWTELIILIGILSIRYKGVRTQEDDVVTLLWRADFKHIEVVAVEGLVASEGDAVDLPSPSDGKAAGPRDAMQAMVFDAPYGFTYPWPNWTERATVERRAVPPSLLGRITQEEGTQVLPLECLQLARELLAGLSDPHDPLTLGEVTPVLYELRGFLVGDLCVEALLAMARMVHGMPGIDDDTRRELLVACVGEDVVRRLTVAVDFADEEALAAVTAIAELAPGDHTSTLLDLFTSSPRYQDSPAVRRLLESQLKGRTGAVVERLGALDPTVAIELFRLLARANPAGSVDAAITLLGRPEPAAQLEALRLLETAEYGGKIGRALVGALASESSNVRLRSLAILVRQRERRAFEPILNRIKLGAAEVGTAETSAGGEAMARLDPEKALSAFKEWVRPSGLLGRLSPGQTGLRSAAVSGLALLPGPESEELLQWLARHAGDELSQQCDLALARLRGKTGRIAVVDAITMAQQQLGKTLARARVEEDRELANRVREVGGQLAHLLNGLFRMAKTHALNNTAFDVPVREFGTALHQLIDLLGPVSLLCVEDQVYVNDLRIRFDKLIEKSISLGDELIRHGIGGLSFNGPLADAEIRAIVRLFAAPPAPGNAREAVQAGLVANGMSSLQVHGPFRFRVTGEELEQATAAFREVYVSSAGTVASVFANVGADRLPSPLPARRLIHQLIDASRTGDIVESARSAEGALPPFAQHTLMVTNLSFLIGRAADFSDASLADLGVSAMFHDVGFCMHEDGYSVPFERHTRAGLRVLLRQRGFHRAKLRRLLSVLQHHAAFDDPRGVPSLHARIIHIADDYDILTRYRAGRGSILSTPDCLARLAAQAGKAYDPLLLQLFCNEMGRFPPGAILSLADGHTVLSISTVRSPETFDKPLCKVIRRPDGTIPSGEELLDLAEGGRVVKVHQPRE